MRLVSWRRQVATVHASAALRNHFGSILAAWAFAFNAVYNRKLKAIPARVILFYHGIIGMIGTGLYWIIEAIVKKQIRTYSW